MAEKELSKKLGEVEVDGLVTAIDPHIVIGAGVIRKASSGTLKLDRKSVRVGKECRSRWSPYH